MGGFPGGYIIPVPTSLEGPRQGDTGAKTERQEGARQGGPLQGRGRAGPTALRLGGLVSQASGRKTELQAEGWEEGRRKAMCKTENGYRRDLPLLLEASNSAVCSGSVE